jgi:hypothetical protein
MRDEHFGECRFLMDHADDGGFFQSPDDGFRHRPNRRYTLNLAGQTSFTENGR